MRDAGVGLPRSSFTKGRLKLTLDQPFDSLTAPTPACPADCKHEPKGRTKTVVPGTVQGLPEVLSFQSRLTALERRILVHVVFPFNPRILAHTWPTDRPKTQRKLHLPSESQSVDLSRAAITRSHTWTNERTLAAHRRA